MPVHSSANKYSEKKEYEIYVKQKKTLTDLRKLGVLPIEQCVNFSLSLNFFL